MDGGRLVRLRSDSEVRAFNTDLCCRQRRLTSVLTQRLGNCFPGGAASAVGRKH